MTPPVDTRTTIHPIPSGTRDVLPDEMRELRDITEAVRGVFELDGYGEVWTPTLEYEDVLGRGGGAPPAYRVFDDHGEVLALRTDMTIPIARLVATRYPTAEPPLRFCYFAHAYRGVRPHRGQMREFLQAGIELVGAPAPRRHRRGAVGACATRSTRDRAARLQDRPRRRLAVPRRCCARSASTTRSATGSSARSSSATSSRSRPSSRSSELADADAELLLRVPQLRGGPEVLERGRGPGRRRGRRPAQRLRAARARGRRARDLRSRPRARPRLLHGRGLRGLRPGARRAARRRRALRRPARALRAPAARRRLRARRSTACTSRWPARRRQA